MANTGGTILSGASGELSLRHRRTRALLLSSALVPALAVGALLVPTAAEAACNNAINLFGNATLNCNSANGVGVIGTAGNNLTVNLTNGANVGGFGIVGTADNNIIVNTSGTTTSAGLLNGMSYTATNGDVTITNFSSTTSGGVNGLVIVADDQIDLTGFKGKATGVLGDGISATAGGDITADNFTAPASGSAPYISGLVNGMKLESDLGDISVKNFASSAQGGVTGINVSTKVGNINLSGFTGTSTGLLYDGIQAQTKSGNITANNFGANAQVTGLVNGLDLSASVVGNIKVNNFQGTATGTLGAGILAQTAQGDIEVKNFSGSATGGVAGLALTTDNGDLTVTNFSGTAKGTLPLVSSGLYGSADEVITVSTTGNANLSGALAGLNLVQGGDDVNVTLGGATQATGGPLGFGVLINSDSAATGNVDVNTAGGTTVSGGLAGIAINKTSAGGNVTVNTNGIVSSASGVGIGVKSVIDQTTTTSITSAGTTSGGLGGIFASTESVFGNATSTIDTYGPVSGGAGVAITGLATAQGGGKNATSTVEQYGVINNSAAGILASADASNIATTSVKVDNTIDVTGFGVTALASGKTGSVKVETTTAGVINAGTFGILAGASGDDFTVDVTTNAGITAGSQGIIAGLAGDRGKVTVVTNDFINAGSQGIAAGILGDKGTLDVTTNAKITAGSQGIVAGIVGDGGTVTVTNKAEIDAGGSGIIAFNTGGDTTVNVDQKISADGLFGAAAFAGGTGSAVLNVNAAIDPPIIGGAAVTFGSGLAQANVNANVQALGIGILAGNLGTGAVDVNINAGGTIQSDGIGVATFKVGDSGATTIDVDAAIGGLSGTATGGDGIAASAIGTSASSVTPITITTTANGTINAGDDGISVFHLSGGNVDITTNAAITAGDEGIQVLSGTFSTSNVTVTNNAAIDATDNGIFILKGGNGDVAVNANANITSAFGNGIEANALFGDGNVTVAQAASTTITADDIGIIASKSFGDGNVSVTTGESSAIKAGLGGIVALKVFGDSATVGGDAVTVTTGKNSSILTAGVGITAGQAFGDGNVVVTTGEGSTIGSNPFVDTTAPVFAGIVAGKAFGDGNLSVTTGLNSIIFAQTNGITSAHLFGTGDNSVTTGENSAILAGNDGINVTSLFTTGATNVTTGTNSLVQALDDGIVANKFGGSGDLTVTIGATSAVVAGDDGVRVSNRSFGAGDIYVNVLGGTSIQPTVISAGDDAIHAHGWDNVNVTTGSYVQIIGDADQNGAGNAIRISDADIATISIGENNIVSGSGKSWSNAVISVRSDDATNITVGANSTVASWSFFNGDLITAASDIVIDTDVGATTINNYGTIIGRVGLTGNDDIFNNFSSNTWVTVGNNYFGGGNDTVNNPGRIVTALQGAVAETTSFYSLETFNNGDAAYVGAGLLDLRDEAPGQIAWNGARDVTYVSGVFNGVGNSAVGLDTFVGAAGSTSDILQVGGRDVNGNDIVGLVTPGQTQLVIHDVNTGAGAWNLAGIKVVDVVDPTGVTYGKNTPGETASFVISSASTNYSSKFGGVIDKGLFFYDLVAIGNDQYLVGLPDQEVFELPKLVTGAQAIWQETTGVWLDRQADLRTYLQGTTTTLVTKEGIKTVNGAPASVTPGVWGKVIGSWGSRDASDNYAAYGRAYGFDTGYNQNIYGFMAGADFGKEGVFNSNDAVVFGVLGGYVASDLNFSGSPSTANYTGGTVGVYATYLNNNWFLDALFKADFLSMDYQAPTLVGAGYFGQSPDAKNYGFVVDTGYRFYKWGTSGFVDGLATLSYVNTNISNLSIVPGTLVDFGNNDSLRGAIGARVGATAYDAATYRIEASLTGRLWYEFLGDNAVTIYNPGVPFTTVDSFNGLFGEVGLGLNYFAKDSGWNGFTNADIKFGESYVAGSAKGGVRYQW